MNRRDRRRVRSTQLLALVAVSAAMFATVASPSSADVTAVSGSAYGYFSRISLFGGPANPRPCADPPTNTIDCRPRPSVTLPAGGSALITDTVPTADARYGPGIFFTSGPITVTTQGTTGPTGSVTSTANISNTNTSGVEVFTASNVASSCTASEAGVSGTTTITNGTLQTSDGNPNVEGDETVIVLPTNPAPNTTYTGVLNSVGDNFRYVFNEQIVNPDGSITVNAGHQYALGPTAVGELIIGQVVCGVTTGPLPSTTTTLPPTTTTTTAPTTTTRPTTTTLPPTTCGGLTPTIVGTSGNDSITGTPGPDVIAGGGGYDSIQGLGGDDVICGGDGNDQIFGGEGNDRIFGDAGNDQLWGEAGNDTIAGGTGADRLTGGEGNDALDGGADADQCLGDAGTDTAAACESTIGIP